MRHAAGLGLIVLGAYLHSTHEQGVRGDTDVSIRSTIIPLVASAVAIVVVLPCVRRKRFAWAAWLSILLAVLLLGSVLRLAIRMGDVTWLIVTGNALIGPATAVDAVG